MSPLAHFISAMVSYLILIFIIKLVLYLLSIKDKNKLHIKVVATLPLGFADFSDMHVMRNGLRIDGVYQVPGETYTYWLDYLKEKYNIDDVRYERC